MSIPLPLTFYCAYSLLRTLIINISYLMESPIDDTIKEQIIKYGTIAIDAMIEMIVPFLPPFIDKKDIHSIAILLLTVVTPAAFVGGAVVTVSALSDIAIFGCKSAAQITKFGAKVVYYTGKTTLNAVVSTAALTTDLLICKPLYLISYPFRNHHKRQEYQKVMRKIKESKVNTKEELHKFAQITKDSDKVFLVIRSIDSSEKISVKMVGNVGPNEPLTTVFTYLKQKHLDIEKESIQFICNRNIVNINTKVRQLHKNQYGFVDLYFTQMESFG